MSRIIITESKDWKVIKEVEGMSTKFIAEFTWRENREFITEMEATLFAIGKSYWRYYPNINSDGFHKKAIDCLLGLL